jgi:uncharacterized protein
MYYILFYKTCDDYIKRRIPYRNEHLALVDQYKKNGQIFMAGAYADPADGAAIVFKCDDERLVKEFAMADPYVREGLIEHWAVRKWLVVVM